MRASQLKLFLWSEFFVSLWPSLHLKVILCYGACLTTSLSVLLCICSESFQAWIHVTGSTSMVFLSQGVGRLTLGADRESFVELIFFSFCFTEKNLSLIQYKAVDCSDPSKLQGNQRYWLLITGGTPQSREWTTKRMKGVCSEQEEMERNPGGQEEYIWIWSSLENGRVSFIVRIFTRSTGTHMGEEWETSN